MGLRHLLLIALLQQVDGWVGVDLFLLLRLRCGRAAELRRLDCGVGHIEGRFVVLLRLLLRNDVVNRQRLHALHHALGPDLGRSVIARLEFLLLVLLRLYSEKVRHVGVRNVLHWAFSGLFRLGLGGVLAQLAQRLGNFDVRGLVLHGVRRGRLRIDVLLVQLLLRRAAALRPRRFRLRCCCAAAGPGRLRICRTAAPDARTLRLLAVDHHVIPLRIRHFPRGLGLRTRLHRALHAAALAAALRLCGARRGLRIVKLVVFEHTFYILHIAALFHVMLALLGAALGPTVEALGAAVDQQAQQGDEQQGDESAPLAQVGVEGVGQQRADRAAALAVLVGLADEVGEAGDAHAAEDLHGGEELHRGEGAQEQQHIGDDVDDADAAVARGEHQQHADPHEEQGDQHADAAAGAPQHIANGAHRRARSGRDEADVTQQQRNADAGHRTDDFPRRADALRPILIYALFVLICHASSNGFDGVVSIQISFCFRGKREQKEPRHAALLYGGRKAPPRAFISPSVSRSDRRRSDSPSVSRSCTAWMWPAAPSSVPGRRGRPPAG